MAFTEEISKSLLIKAKDKREIQKIFRQIGKSRIFIYPKTLNLEESVKNKSSRDCLQKSQYYRKG